MLVGFYAPQLTPYLNELEDARTSYGEVLAQSLRLESQQESVRKETHGHLIV